MDILLKQRMVGAIVLISLGIIFIPMLLSGKGDVLEGNDKSNIPPIPKYEIKKAEIPPPMVNSKADVKDHIPSAASEQGAATSAVATPTSAASQQPAIEKSTVEEKPAPTSPAKVETKTALASKASAPTSTTPTPTTSTQSTRNSAAQDETTSPHPVTGWVVQIGSFESHDNAEQLRDKLRTAGFAAFIEPRKGKTTVYRVRVGPEKRRSQAEKLQQELQAKQKIKGVIMHFPD